MGPPRWQFSRFRPEIFSTPCIWPRKQYLHYTMIFFLFVALWQDMRESTKKQATWTTLSYHIWKVVSRLIVTDVMHFGSSAQLFVAKICPTFVFISHHPPPTLHPNASHHFSYCIELFVFKHWGNRRLRNVTGNITHGHMRTPRALLWRWIWSWGDTNTVL